MQRDLSRLTVELRKETCPRRVLEEVERRISARRSAPWRWRLASGCAVVVVLLLFGVSVWRWELGKNIRQQAKLAESAREHLRVANEAQDALDLVGSVLLDAGTSSEKIISDKAVPPLRDSLEIAKNKIIQNREL